MSWKVPILVASASFCWALPTALASSGTSSRCQLPDGSLADVFISGTGRDVTFQAEGRSFDLRSRSGGGFTVRSGSQTYAFDPRYGNGPAILVITSKGGRKVIECES